MNYVGYMNSSFKRPNASHVHLLVDSSPDNIFDINKETSKLVNANRNTHLLEENKDAKTSHLDNQIKKRGADITNNNSITSYTNNLRDNQKRTSSLSRSVKSLFTKSHKREKSNDSDLFSKKNLDIFASNFN
jgi:hypothetical protein